MLRIGLVLAGLLASAASAAQPATGTLPELNNYAWGFPIDTDVGASFYRIPLPLAVNASAADSRLRDTGVYNADGQPVPRVIEAAADAVQDVEQRSALPLMPLFRNQEDQPEQLRMIFEHVGDTTRVDVRADRPSNEKIRAPLTAYVADARGSKKTIAALEFVWPAGIGSFIGRITVEGSNDFADWQPLGNGALAELREGDAVIAQRVLDLDAGASHFDFLRIRWSDLPADWRLAGLQAIHRAVTTVSNREWLRIAETARDEEDNGRIFDLEAKARVDRLDLHLPEPNTIIGADIYYWADASMRWVRAAGGTFYRIRRDQNSVSSKPVSITPVRAARWKVRLHQGRPDAPFELSLGWRPDSLLFVAQGRGPYTLATGRPAAGADYYPEERQLGDSAIRDLAEQNGPVATATLGKRFPLGGVPHKQTPPPGPDWQTLLLWSVLLVAVLFVGYMATRIVREL